MSFISSLSRQFETYCAFSFLDDLERVTSLRYTPTDDDVLKARLKTVGVSEYKFKMEVSAGRDTGTEWRIVDVGGSRSQRRESLTDLQDPCMLIISCGGIATWAPFFDDGEWSSSGNKFPERRMYSFSCLGSGCYYFSRSNIRIRPSSRGGQECKPTCELFSNF